MRYQNAVKKALQAGTTVYGPFQGMASVAVSEILGAQGFDWILADLEHGQIDLETAGNLFAAIRRGGATPLARVSGNDQFFIKRVLDAGAEGIMVPLVNSPEEALLAVRSCYYPPKGVRGLGPGRASLYGLEMLEYAQAANEETLVMLQAEHIDAVRRIEEILRVPGIDILFVGPFDLACSMGHMDNPGHPEVEAAIETLLAAALRAGVVPGIFCAGPEAAARRARQGFRFVALGLDSFYLDAGAKAAQAALKKALGS
ncbi:MAG: hpcH [Spirochaetes bacterium]|nr:MAG: hpcH [Spirochaetota bacterium]